MYSMGVEFGYLMPSVYLPNPLDQFLVLLQKLFPFDLAVVTTLIAAITLATASGFQHLGIGIPWVKV